MEQHVIRYTIPLQVIEEGRFEITYQIQKEFIEENSIEDICNADITLHIVFNKKQHLHTLEYSLLGKVIAPCDRCLEECEIPVSITQTVICKDAASSQENFEEEDDVILFHENDDIIDITEHVYDSLCISLPIQKVHSNRKICDVFLKAFTKKEITKKEIDPRWETLKNIQSNN